MRVSFRVRIVFRCKVRLRFGISDGVRGECLFRMRVRNRALCEIRVRV